MNKEKNNNFPWETLDTTNLMNPEELIAFHIYKLAGEIKAKKEKGIKDTSVLLSSYLLRESTKKEEEMQCLQK